MPSSDSDRASALKSECGATSKASLAQRGSDPLLRAMANWPTLVASSARSFSRTASTSPVTCVKCSICLSRSGVSKVACPMRRTLITASASLFGVLHDAHVARDRAGSAPSHYQGIDLDVLDCAAVIEKQAPERKRRMCKRTGIARGLRAKPGKKFGELQLSEHACHVILCDRQEPQGDIAGELDQNPTCADEQEGAVERSRPRADDGLHSGDHLLDQESAQARLRMRFPRLRQQRLGGRLHFLASAQVKRDPAGFGLVQDLVGTNLQCDREADALGRR